jgi:hypothetical protein
MLNHLLKNVISVKQTSQKNKTHLLVFIYLDVGRTTYAEMLYRTNIIAYVPADDVTGLASNVGKREICLLLLSKNILVNVYDDQRKIHVLELSFNSSVISIRMSRTRFGVVSFNILYFFVLYRLLVVLMNQIQIFSFPNQCRLLHTIETRINPRGLFRIISFVFQWEDYFRSL